LALKYVGAINEEQYNNNCQSSVHLFVYYTYSKKCPCWTGQRVGVRQREIPKLMPEAASSVAT